MFVWVAQNGDGTVKKIDPVGDTVIKTITVGTGPGRLLFTPGFLWVLNSGTTTITKIDLFTETVVGTVTGLDSSPEDLTTDGSHIWVVCSSGAGKLFKVDMGSNTILNNYTIGGTPASITWGAGYLWISQYTANTVAQVDTSGSIVGTVTGVTTNPRHGFFDGTDLWIVAHSGTLYKINTGSATVSGSVSLGGSSVSFSVFGDGTHIWATMYGSSGFVAKVDPSSVTVITTVAAPFATGVAWDNSYIWVGVNDTKIYKVDPTSATVVDTITSSIGSDTQFPLAFEYDAPFLLMRRKDVRQKKFNPDLTRGRTRRSRNKPIPYFGWTETYTQGFRIEDTSLFLYELYVGENGPVDYTAPVATSATLPFSWTPSLPSSGTAVYNVVVRQKNRYSMESFNVLSTQLKFVAHVPVLAPVHAPTNVIVYDDVSGYIRVVGKYVSTPDGINPADTWELYVKFGSDPVPGTDTPVFTGPMTFLGVEAGITQLAGAYTPGTIAHVILVAKRSSDSSRGAAAVILHELAVNLNLSEGFLFGGNTFEDQ